MPKVPMIQLAEEVRDVGRVLIAKYHPHLADAKVLFLFTDQKRKRCERIRLGSAAKMTSLQRFLASTLESVESGPDFILMFDINEWALLDEKQRRAVTDHELLHCACAVPAGPNKWRLLQPDEDKSDFTDFRWTLRGHSIEEFHEVLERYGWWRNDEAEHKVSEAVRQMALPGMKIIAQSRN